MTPIQTEKSMDQFMIDYFYPEDTAEFNCVQLQKYIRSQMRKDTNGELEKLKAYIARLKAHITKLEDDNFELLRKIPKFKVYA